MNGVTVRITGGTPDGYRGNAGRLPVARPV